MADGLIKFFTSIVRFDGLRLDDHTRVTLLQVLTLGRYGSRYVTARQSERGAQCRQRCDQHGDDDLDNLLLAHNSLIANR